MLEQKLNIIEYIKKNTDNFLLQKFSNYFFSFLPYDYSKKFSNQELLELCKFSFENIVNILSNNSDISINQNLNNCLVINVASRHKSYIIESIQYLLENLNIRYDFFQYPYIGVKRDENNKLVDFGENFQKELIVTFAVKNFNNYDVTKKIENKIREITDKLELIESILPNIHERFNDALKDLKNSSNIEKENIQESVEFLKWLNSDNFIFLGFIKFDLKTKSIAEQLGNSSKWNDEMDVIWSSIEKTYHQKNEIISFGKINKISVIDRNNFIDFVIIKNFDSEGNFVSGRIFIGLYSSNILVYKPKNIPIIRKKLESLYDGSNSNLAEYTSRRFNLIVESLPKDAIFHINSESLKNLCFDSLSAMSLSKMKLFMPNDCSQNFVELILLIPRNKLTPDVYNKLYQFIAKKFNTVIVKDYLNEINQNYVFLYFTFASNFCVVTQNDQDYLETEIENITSFWLEHLHEESINQYGSSQALTLFEKYKDIFPKDYQYKFSPEEAAKDFGRLDSLNDGNNFLFFIDYVDANYFSLKIFSNDKKMTLSSLMPILENFGFIVDSEQTFKLGDNWLYHFKINNLNLSFFEQNSDFELNKNNIQIALKKIAEKSTKSDYLCRLISFCNFEWRETDLFRAISHYIHQTQIGYDFNYINEVLVKHLNFAQDLKNLFISKFDPLNNDILSANSYYNKLLKYLDKVEIASEDKILRSYLAVFNAMKRVNFFQKSNDGLFKEYISFKLKSSEVPNLPMPVPFAEIFVFSSEFKGIHLRGGKIARGGIRWSDRSEDLRTEIFGLMKAQLTKNTVIVPEGSKGGFFVDIAQGNMSKEEYQSLIINCYKNFLRGLLDLTDNVVYKEISHPTNTIIYDNDDPYLVVAADKGTASFSDYANSVSKEYDFWLSDAFASGGTHGYDHKKMGITAKGAWISVRNHFKKIGIDVDNDVTNCVGIGDMSGDVFGNGMLMTNKIKLVAAFNHIQIFIDPNPNPENSFEERKRLFYMPASKWSDYNPELISKGGGFLLEVQKL